MTETEELLPIKFEQREGIKLTRNSKGYTWEIKLVGDLDDKQIERLDKINLYMLNKYGTTE